jgi:hypothetical protein
VISSECTFMSGHQPIRPHAETEDEMHAKAWRQEREGCVDEEAV